MRSRTLLLAVAASLALTACTVYERRVAAVPVVVQPQTVVTEPAIVAPPVSLLPQTSSIDVPPAQTSYVEEWTTPPPGNWDYVYTRRTTTTTGIP